MEKLDENEQIDEKGLNGLGLAEDIVDYVEDDCLDLLLEHLKIQLLILVAHC